MPSKPSTPQDPPALAAQQWTISQRREHALQYAPEDGKDHL
ncbi:hypothetical protein [Corynebacterium striatum]|nr:hypothetical protein [Corynebacterium striatum]